MKVVPGTLVDFFSEGEIIAGVVLCEEKGRLRVATESGREDRIAPGRVLAAYEGNPRLALVPGKPEPAKLQEAHKLASAHARIARERSMPLDLGLVWEIVVDDPGERTLDDLAELATGERSAPACAAMLRALLEEKVHFTRRGDLWEPRARGAVEEILKQKEAERRREEERRRFLDRARLALTGRAKFARSGEDAETRWLKALEELAVHGSATVDAREALVLLAELGIRFETPEEGAFRALEKLGVFSPDENLFIRRFGLQVEFPSGIETLASEAIAQALGAPEAAPPAADVRPPAGGGDLPAEQVDDPRTGAPAPRLAEEIARGLRRDLTGLELFSVDDELTSEIDDALSVEPLGGGRFRVGIHIADPGCFLRPDSELDLIAQSRAVTFYLPDRRVLMLPPLLSESAASILPGAARPSLSFLTTLDEEGALLDWEIVSSVVRSRARVSYEEADAVVHGAGAASDSAGRSRAGAEGGEGEGGAARPSGSAPSGPPGTGVSADVREQLSILHRLALALEAGRITNGAHLIRAPEVDLQISEDGAIILKRMEGDGPGRVLVSEMMILASRIAASFCLERSIPCIYRKQPPPDESFPSVNGGPYDPVAVRKARRGMRRSESGLLPGRHFALGLDAYAQATSPIRRYQDLVIHRQIKSVLGGQAPCYDADALQRIAALTDEAERTARLAERGSDEYWMLRYLETRKGQPVEGVVVFIDRRRVEVELSETLYTVSIAPRSDHELGQHLRFQIESVNPRGPSIHLRQLE